MISFAVEIGGDVPATLCDMFAEIGSLCVARQRWADVIASMGVEVLPYLQQTIPGIDAAASALVTEAVPEEGHPHPQRAEYWFLGGDSPHFTTPGGVEVHLSPIGRDDHISVEVDFNRDSHYLAVQVLAGLCRREFKQAIGLLALVAIEASEAGA